jgi:hypothetical protein
VQFVCIKPTGRAPEALLVDHGRLFDKDMRIAAVKSDDGAEARRPGARGGGCDQDGAEADELIGLHNDCVTSESLLTPTGSARVGQAKDLATHHFSQEAQVPAQPSALG